MADRFDDLFSPERLRRNWQPGGGKPDRPRKPVSPDSEAVLAVWDQIHTYVERHITGEAGDLFVRLADELKNMLLLRFPEEGPEPAAEEREALNAAIEELISQMEDMFEAIEQARRIRPAGPP